MKYPKETILNYITGGDIPDFSLDDLENDPIFMENVIKTCRDKNMYSLCSDEVKKDYFFTRFLLETFNDDIEFCEMVADSFIKLSDPNAIEVKEISIIMDKIFKKTKEVNVFSIKALTFYMEEMSTLNEAKRRLEKENDNFGMGFCLLQIDIPGSDAIHEYFATKMIDEIFFTKRNFIASIHKRFKTYDELESYGINNYIIETIGLYDEALAAYVVTHMNVIDGIKKELKGLQKNWILDEQRIYIDKIDTFYRYVEEEMDTHFIQVRYNEFDAIRYIIKKLNIEDIFKKYDCDYDLLEEDDCSFDFNKNELTFMEAKCINDLMVKAQILFECPCYGQEVNRKKEGKVVLMYGRKNN